MGAEIGVAALTETRGEVKATEYDTGIFSNSNLLGATAGPRRVVEGRGGQTGYWGNGGRTRGSAAENPADVTDALRCGGGGGSANLG